MSEHSSEADSSELTPLNFIYQVVKCIQSQIAIVDEEVLKSLKIAGKDKQIMDLVKVLSSDLNEIRNKSGKILTMANNLQTLPDSIENFNETLTPVCGSVLKLTKLSTNLDELEKEILDNSQFGYYQTVADLLKEIKEDIKVFEPFSCALIVKNIKFRQSNVENEIVRQIHWAMREIGQLVENSQESEVVTGDPPAHIQALTDLSLVVDVLGPSCLKDLLERFSQLQLIPYEKKFQVGKQYSDLNNLEHRWNWFRKLVKSADDKLSDVFPKFWNLNYHLYLEFCRRTKIHLNKQLIILEQKNLAQNEHIELLLTALKNVLTFAQEIKTQLGLHELSPDNEEQMLAESIGDAFDLFLDPYIKLERSKLDELIQSMLLQEEQSNSVTEVTAELAIPFESSRNMFDYIKKSLKRCSTFSNGNTLLSLSMEFRICLQQYAESLSFRLPQPLDPIAYREGRIELYVKGKNPHAPTYHVPSEITLTLCRIIKTGEYCSEVVPQLEEQMKKLIRPSMAHEVEFTSQIDTFHDLCTKTLQILVIGVINRLEKPFKSMRRINWGLVDVLGDPSPYTGQLLDELTDIIPSYRQILSTIYFRNFCTKLALEVLDKFVGYILKQKKITMVGAEQLLVDCDVILPIMHSLSHVGLSSSEEKPSILQAHLSVVSTKMNYIQVILKLLRVEESVLNESFKLLWPEGKPSDLQLIKEIRIGRDVSLLQGTKLAGDKAIKSMGNVVNKVGEVTGAKVVTTTVTSTAKDAVSGLASGMKSMGSGMKSAMGGLLSGDLFGDNSKSNSKKPK